MVFLEPHGSLLHMTMAQKRLVILKGKGEKSPQLLAENSQCTVSSGTSTGKIKVKANMPKKFLNQRETVT